MNYPEEFRERYNEVMFDERDIIEQFLKDLYDIRYGHQRDTWHFVSAVKMLSRYGNIENVTDIMLDKDRFVIFILDDAREFECFDFAYGELSKVIDALPEVEDVVRRVAESDLKDFAMNYNTEVVLCHFPFKYNDKTIVDFYFDGDKLICEFEEQGWTEVKSNDLFVKLRDHVKEVTLRSSDVYKSVYDFIEICPNKTFEPTNHGKITFTLYETNTEVNVISIIIGENGKMVMTAEDNGEYMTLRERDIRPDYLRSVEEYIELNHWVLMGFFNGHQCSLVNKINDAWRNESLREQFGLIVYAIAKRDYDETVEKVSNIDDMGDFLASIIDDQDKSAISDVLENVCDDNDLNTILSFIGYEE